MDINTLIEEFFKALGRSLYFIFGAPDAMKNIDWASFAVTAIVKLTIIVLLLLLFYGIYRLLHVFLYKVAIRFKLKDDIRENTLTGLKYIWLLDSAIIIAAQVGIPFNYIRSSVRAVFVASIFYGVWIFSDHIIDRIVKNYKFNPSIQQLLYNITNVLIFLMAIAALMAQFGFDLVSIVAGLGIVGIAVGFAAQSTLADFIAGVTILIEQPFQIGDWVRINNDEGKVEKISLRTTHIRTRTNMSVILPNAKVASADVTNLSARQLSAYTVDFGIAYEADLDKTRQVVLDKVKNEFDLILKNPTPVVRISALADSGVNLVLFYWIANGNIDKQVAINAELLESIKNILDAENIEIPYPHVQLMQGK